MSELIAYSLIAMSAWFGINELLGTSNSGRRGGRSRGGSSRSRGRRQFQSRRDYDDY